MDSKTFLKQTKFPAHVDINRMHKVITQSRGEEVTYLFTSHHEEKSNGGSLSEINDYDNVDVLKFCATM